MKITSMKKYLIRRISHLGDKVSLNQEQLMIKEMAQDFAKENLLPFANKWDAKSHFPIDVIKKTAELGFGGICVNEDYGGSALGKLESSIIFESLSYGCISTAAFISIHNMVNAMINDYGNEEQK